MPGVADQLLSPLALLVESPLADDRIGVARAAGRRVERMAVVHQALVERILRVDVDAVLGDDVVVLQADATVAGLALIGLEVEHHALL